jgi:hypothetical protein
MLLTPTESIRDALWMVDAVRNRIINLTHFQQHAGQRTTLKTIESNRKPTNRAQMERRDFASPAPSKRKES